jgi:hypothetical protein
MASLWTSKPLEITLRLRVVVKEIQVVAEFCHPHPRDLVSSRFIPHLPLAFTPV